MKDLTSLFGPEAEFTTDDFLQRGTALFGCSREDTIRHFILFRHLLHNMMMDECEAVNSDPARFEGKSAYEVVRAAFGPDRHRPCDTIWWPIAKLLDQIPEVSDELDPFVFAGVKVDIDPQECERMLSKLGPGAPDWTKNMLVNLTLNPPFKREIK